MRHITLILLFLFTIEYSNSQTLIDTILTNNNVIIECKVTYVNNYSVFYKYKKKNKIKDGIIQRIDVKELIINSKNVTVLEKKIDSGINQYYRKSKLNKTYKPLLLKENTFNQLIILADSTFHSKNTDYFFIANQILTFSEKYKSKLIYVSNIKLGSEYTINVKLYDAPDEYYKKTHDLYNNNKIYFIRTNNKFEKEEYEFKYNNRKIILKKNQYISINKKDSNPDANEYYYIGYPNGYSTNSSSETVSMIGTISSGLLSGNFIYISKNYEKYNINPFIGEFMLLNINNEKQSTTIYKRNAQ